MSEDVRPALTEQEWRLLKLWNAGKMPGGKVRGMVVLDLPDEHRPGAAACALYNQPYGFTWSDVDDLRRLSNPVACGAVGDGDTDDAPAFQMAIRVADLANRIAALLPPR